MVERARQLVAATRFEEVEMGLLGVTGTALEPLVLVTGITGYTGGRLVPQPSTVPGGEDR